MRKLNIAGQITKLEAGQTKTGGVYYNVNIESCSLKEDGQPQFITDYTVVFNDYTVAQISNGLIQVGDYVYGDGYVTANAYTAKDGTNKASLNITLTSLTNLSLGRYFKNQQPVAQPQYTQQVAQPQPQYTQPQQPMMTTQTVYHHQPQANNGQATTQTTFTKPVM